MVATGAVETSTFPVGDATTASPERLDELLELFQRLAHAAFHPRPDGPVERLLRRIELARHESGLSLDLLECGGDEPFPAERMGSKISV